MNIFFLDRSPATAARMHCDRHVVKMIVESAQLLSTAHHLLDGATLARSRFPDLLKPTHVNHPCALWVRQSREHYDWLGELMSELCDEYHRRYGPNVHAYRRSRLDFRLRGKRPLNIPLQGWHEPPLCMPGQYKRSDAVEAYRLYYAGEKREIATWRAPAEAPSWWPESCATSQ